MARPVLCGYADIKDTNVQEYEQYVQNRLHYPGFARVERKQTT